jgi:hypothetical protein
MPEIVDDGELLTDALNSIESPKFRGEYYHHYMLNIVIVLHFISMACNFVTEVTSVLCCQIKK